MKRDRNLMVRGHLDRTLAMESAATDGRDAAEGFSRISAQPPVGSSAFWGASDCDPTQAYYCDPTQAYQMARYGKRGYELARTVSALLICRPARLMA